MAGVTNKGKKCILNAYFTADTSDEPTGFKIALVTSATAPTADTNVLTDLTEITAGNGYTAGGATLNRNSTDFDTVTEDDTNDRGFVQIKDVVWTASGGPIPASGNGARYAVLLDDNTTPNLLAYWDLQSDRQVSDGQSLTLQDCEIRFNET
jgi:hypothetical protein